MTSLSHSDSAIRRLLLAASLPLGLLAVALVLSVIDPRSLSQTLAWVDGGTLVSLVALLAVAQAIRASGIVQRCAHALLRSLHTQRAVAMTLMALSAGLAMLLTNDVALFLVVPLTLALAEMASLPSRRLVVVEALAVNAGSALSPIGNPQNLLLWQHSTLSMWDFVLHMAGTAGLMAALLAGTVWLVFSAAAIEPDQPAVIPEQLDRQLAVLAAVLLPCLIVLLESGHGLLAASGVLAVLCVMRPRVVRNMDWGLVVTVGLLMIVLGHLVSLPAIAQYLGQVDWRRPSTVLLGGVLLSQTISNVPATIALLDRVPDTMLLASAVNIGGAGLAVGSLANLIALRLEGSRRIWGTFHAISVPYLLVVFLIVRFLA